MTNCLHNAMSWKTFSAKDLENTILKPAVMNSIFGFGFKVSSGECVDCKKTVIEITPHGYDSGNDSQEWINPFSLRGLIQPGLNAINDKISKIDERLKYIEDSLAGKILWRRVQVEN